MAARSNRNSIESLCDGLGLGFSNDIKDLQAFINKFKFGESIDMHYWRTESAPSPFKIRDFVSIQRTLFNMGWLHTNFFYQSKGRLSIKATNLITDVFINGLMEASETIAHRVPLASRIVSNYSIPVDEAKVFIFSFTTEKAALLAKNNFISKEYNGINNPKTNEDSTIIIYEMNNGAPLIVIMNYPGLNISRKVKNIISLIPSFDAQKNNYNDSRESKIKDLEKAFDVFKSAILNSGKFKQIDELKNEKNFKNIDFVSVYKSVINIFSEYLSVFNYNSIMKHKEFLINLSNFIELYDPEKLNSSSYFYRFFQRSSEFRLDSLNPYRNTFVDFNKPISRTIKTRLQDFVIFDNITPPEISDFSYLEQINNLISSYDEGYDNEDLQRLISLIKDVCEYVDSQSDFPSMMVNSSDDLLRGYKITFYDFVNKIRSTLTYIFVDRFKENAKLFQLDYRDDTNINVLCNLIFDTIYEGDENQNLIFVKEDFLTFVKFFLKETMFSIHQTTENNNFLKISNMLTILNSYIKIDYPDNWYYPTYREEYKIMGSTYGTTPSCFAINKEDGRICLINFNVKSSDIIDLITDKKYFSKNHKSLNDYSKFIQVLYLEANDEGGLQKLDKSKVCKLYINENFDENGDSIPIRTYKELADYMYSDDSGLNLYFQYFDFSRKITCKIINEIKKLNYKDTDIIYYRSKEIINNSSISSFSVFSKFSSSYSTGKNQDSRRYYIKFIDNESSEYSEDLYLKYDKSHCETTESRNHSIIFNVTTNPIVVNSNDMNYSLSRIKYSLVSGLNTIRVSSMIPNSKISIIYRGVDFTGIYIPSFSMSPINADKYSSSTTSYNLRSPSSSDKAGHPHFSHRGFICNAGLGSKAFYTWIYDNIISGHMLDTDIIGYDEKNQLYYVKIHKKHFIQWLDSQIFDMDTLTKSCYNRKTRSHNGLNIEEWTHCRIE